MKTYTIAGTSNLNGVVKLRVANGSVARRVAVLKSAGHTDINLVELPEAMTRSAAGEFLQLTASGLKVVAPVAVERTNVDAELDVVVDLETA